MDTLALTAHRPDGRCCSGLEQQQHSGDDTNRTRAMLDATDSNTGAGGIQGMDSTDSVVGWCQSIREDTLKSWGHMWGLRG